MNFVLWNNSGEVPNLAPPHKNKTKEGGKKTEKVPNLYAFFAPETDEVKKVLCCSLLHDVVLQVLLPPGGPAVFMSDDVWSC